MEFNKIKKINFKKGQVMLLTAIFFMTFALVICLGFTNPIVNQFKISSGYWDIKNNYYLAESGVEDLIYRFMNGFSLDETDTISLNGSIVSTYSSGEESGKVLVSQYNDDLYTKKVKAEVHKAGDNKFEIIDWREIK